ncbi:mating type protein MAT1-2-1 [Aspergillus ambiguus]|uniref:HMG-box domain-containing protein n=1 Tax=Aspergillus ambiguus TaxID=176160 RepID=UPI003CCDB89D
MATLPLITKPPTDSTDKLTELLWQDALRHLESTNNEVLLPVNITDIIGQDNVNKIKSRLCALIGAPVVAFIDENISALRVMRTPDFSGSVISVATHDRMSNIERYSIQELGKANSKHPMPVKTAKVPRPPNAFILYRQHHHPKVKEAHPHLSNNEISIILGKQWKSEGDETKVHFRNLAEEFKRKHAEDHPDYHYSPRKPSEKKRRTSSRQQQKTARILESPPSTNGTSNVSTPTMYPNMPMGNPAITGAVGDISGLGGIISPSDSHDQGLDFDAEAFDNLLQQVQNDHNKTVMYQQISYPDVPVGDCYEFSEFVADCF